MDRIDDQQLRFDFADVSQDDLQVGFCHQEQFLWEGYFALALTFEQAYRPHFDLPLGFFAGNIQHRVVFGHFYGGLQQQGRFANARIAADQHHGARYDTASQDARKLFDRYRDAFLNITADVRDAPGRGCAR